MTCTWRTHSRMLAALPMPPARLLSAHLHKVSHSVISYQIGMRFYFRCRVDNEPNPLALSQCAFLNHLMCKNIQRCSKKGCTTALIICMLAIGILFLYTRVDLILN